MVDSPAFGVLAAALRSWTRSNEMPETALAPFAPGLRQVLPEWAAGAPTPVLSPDQLRLLVLEGALRLLVHAAGRQGAVLLLDDLHEADPETVEFIHHVAGSVSDMPVLVIAAARTPEGRQVEAEARALEAHGQASVLELDPLDEDQVGTVVEAILGAPPPAELVNDIYLRTDGVPLLVEEMVEARLAGGSLRVEWGSVRYSPQSRVRLPRTTAELVQTKLSRVGEDTRRTLAAAAVLRRFEPELLSAVAGLSWARVGQCLKDGVAVGLLEATPAAVTFRHSLLSDALVEIQLPPERIELHRRAAEALARQHGDDPDWFRERAHHLEAIGEDDAASELLTADGRRSLSAQAPASAEAVLVRAGALARRPDTKIRAGDALAEATGNLGRWDEALRLDAELLAAGGETPERLERMAANAVSAGRLDEADELIGRARSVGADSASLTALSALIMLWRGRLHEAIEAGERAVTEARTRGDGRAECQALDVLGRSSDALGRRHEARAYFERWVGLAERADLTPQLLQGLMELRTLDFLSGGPADRLRQARDLATRHAIFIPLVLADLSLLWWLGRRARVAEAVAMGEEAVELCRRFSLDLMPHALIALAWARSLARCDGGEPLIAEAQALAPSDGDIEILAGWMRGESALRLGRAEQAAALFQEATRLMHAAPSSAPPPAPFLWIAALLLAGHTDEARSAMPEVRSSPALSRQ